MLNQEPSFTVGIEEEYLLVDEQTGDLIKEAPPSMLPECEELLEGQVTPEFLQSQIEVGTRVCTSIREAREDLTHLRKTVAQVASRHGLAMIAASTHPFATAGSQQTTAKERYRTLADDLQAVVRRLMISGMHVHVGLDDDDLRIDLLPQVAYFAPHLLALSTSSPFWEGQNTGLRSYRLAVWNELPRTGLPETFTSYAEYLRHVDVLVNAGVIEDASKVWWDVRPSSKFSTLEMRICDICTRVEDTICIAAIYRCWLRMLYRLKMKNQRWRLYSQLLIGENRWRAHRYGSDRGLIDFGLGVIVPFADLLEEMLEHIKEDAESLNCVSEVEHARTILKRGTSAHTQVGVYEKAMNDGADQMEALRVVVSHLVDETLVGI